MSEVLVEVWRGSFLECQHRGHAVIVNSSGDILESWGNPSKEILPRSACKILQALPLVETGAADAFCNADTCYWHDSRSKTSRG